MAFRNHLLIVLLSILVLPARAQVSFGAKTPAYIVFGKETALDTRTRASLSSYLSKVTGKVPVQVSKFSAVPATAATIVLSSSKTEPVSGLKAPANSPESFSLKTIRKAKQTLVIAVGNSDKGLKRAVQQLIIRSDQQNGTLVIPALDLAESPWIPKREWTLCVWAPDQVRGVFNNPNADKRPNVWLYGDKQLTDYTDMFDWFGFSGTQLMETAATYAVVGSRDATQDRLRKIAAAAKNNGQDVTLWVWAAQFNNYGWVDNHVTYIPEKGKTAFTDPKVRASFEDYYNGYARMAPYTDMLITHFYDPGSLPKREDVFQYMKLIHDKFKVQNPKVKLGVDFWASDSDSAYMKSLIENGFKDALLLESTMPHYYPPGKREALHAEAKKQGVKLGVWGWHTAEIETDQNPTMHVNAKLLSTFYKQVKAGADKIHPITYWSEMEAYHLNNIFTLYAAGQLLWNPDRNPDEILEEISVGIWGHNNGKKVLDALQLIQDVRTGPTWETYWGPNQRIGTADPKADLARAEKSIAEFEQLKTDEKWVPKFPLPFPPATFIELTLPHLWQIRDFARFRIELADLRALAKNGASKDELNSRLVKIWDPVREYSNWVGTFSQIETRVQENMLLVFAKEYGLTLQTPGWMRFRDAGRLLQVVQNKQRKSDEPIKFTPEASWYEFRWPKEKGMERFNLLLENGSVKIIGENQYQLANWEEYKKR